MADGLAFVGVSGVLLLADDVSELLTLLQSPEVVTAGVPGFPGVPLALKNWPKLRTRERERERVPVYDASPVVVQADSIDDIELVLLDLI